MNHFLILDLDLDHRILMREIIEQDMRRESLRPQIPIVIVVTDADPDPMRSLTSEVLLPLLTKEDRLAGRQEPPRQHTNRREDPAKRFGQQQRKLPKARR